MAALFRVKALYDYSSPHEDDLNFPAGQIIAVTDDEDADWYGGEYVDEAGAKKAGIFPRNFVEKFEPVAPPAAREEAKARARGRRPCSPLTRRLLPPRTQLDDRHLRQRSREAWPRCPLRRESQSPSGTRSPPRLLLLLSLRPFLSRLLLPRRWHLLLRQLRHRCRPRQSVLNLPPRQLRARPSPNPRLRRFPRSPAPLKTALQRLTNQLHPQLRPLSPAASAAAAHRVL
ncbi:uncharacterized protein TrAtP1_012984 [Trichoderma atroviride]|uniref:uncharacterized protein n=1 Tax=Hypocrea atroviridis TaxID=63577 RepID=UPI00332231EA|nr:hypothetical protein TrAtP1_012984 [Trichoderma atroviride]